MRIATVDLISNTVFPLLAGGLIALRFPETRGRELEQTSGDTLPLRF